MVLTRFSMSRRRHVTAAAANTFVNLAEHKHTSDQTKAPFLYPTLSRLVNLHCGVIDRRLVCMRYMSRL